MTTTPDKIWLIDMDGDEFFRDYVWCDCPNPSPGMEESDATEYIRADLLQDPEWLAANGLKLASGDSDITKLNYIVDLGLSLSKVVHDTCGDVPHDIGIKLLEKVQAYLNKAGLMVKPEKCEQCDNSGEVERFVVCSDMECLTCDIGGTAENQCPITEPCPCTKNPNSLYNFIKNGE